MVLFNESRGIALAGNVRMADTFWRRLVGLLDRKKLGCREALIIVPCTSVHTHFMRFSIDVAFVDRRWRVVCVEHDLEPWRFAPGGAEAWAAVELPAGILEETETRVGDQLKLAE